MPYETSLEELEILANGPAPDNWRAIAALAADDSPKSLAALIKLTQSLDYYVRRAAVESIGEHVLGREATGILGVLLSESSSVVQRSALESVADLGLVEHRDQVRSLLNSAESSVRYWAAKTLGVFWQPCEYEVLLRVFKHDVDKDVRSEAARVLIKHVTKTEWRELFDLFAGDVLPRHRTCACEMAKRFGADQVQELLFRLKDDSNGHVRATAKRALESIDTGRVATDISAQRIEDIVRSQIGDAWDETNLHGVHLREALVPPTRIVIIESTLQEGEFHDQYIEVWLVLIEDTVLGNGYRIVAALDGSLFGLAQGNPSEDELVLVGWYGDFMDTFYGL